MLDDRRQFDPAGVRARSASAGARSTTGLPPARSSTCAPPAARSASSRTRSGASRGASAARPAVVSRTNRAGVESPRIALTMPRRIRSAEPPMSEPRRNCRALFHRLNNQLGIILAHAELLEAKAPTRPPRARRADRDERARSDRRTSRETPAAASASDAHATEIGVRLRHVTAASRAQSKSD